MKKRKTNNNHESIKKWIDGIHGEILKPASKSNECFARCQMLEVDNARLKKLIATMEIRR